jgi:ATP-binding cassette, subfamily F, member 3
VLTPGQRVAFLGHNGAGKSTLIKALAGKSDLLAGNLEISPETRIGYFAQHQLEQLDPAASPLLHLNRLNPKATEQSQRDFLGGFDFLGDKALADVGHFSGGEKTRLVLAMLVYQRPNLLLLDEPTNHLDLEMRHSLTLALNDFDGAIVLISHDRHLLRSITDDYMLVDNGKILPFPGDLEDYHDWLRQGGASQEQDQQLTTLTSNSKKEQRRLAVERRAQLKPISKDLKKQELQMEKLQQRKEELEQLLADPEIYQGQAKEQLKQLLKEKGELDQNLEEVEMRWLDLSDQMEAMESELRALG